MADKAFFLMRLNDHIQYLKKIEATLIGKGDFQGSDHHDCKLGQWLYSEGAQEVAALHSNQAQQIFSSLFEIHERFHVTSQQALEKQQAGDEGATQAAITEMHKLSQILSQKLLELDVLTIDKS